MDPLSCFVYKEAVFLFDTRYISSNASVDVYILKQVNF
jgi:hypothetical protein